MDQRPLQIGVGLAQSWAHPEVDALADARRAEALGFDSIWLSDPGRGGPQMLDPVATLAAAAAVTERVGLGVSVLVLPTHHPIRLAQSLATVDQLSAGRLIVGLGIGRPGPDEALYGAPAEHRATHYERAVDTLVDAWAGGAVYPKPVRQPRPPIWFGGAAPDALERAARRGDGWTAAGSGAWAEVPAVVGAMQAALDRHGRDPASFVMGKRVYLAVEADEATALERMRVMFQRVYGRAELADRVAIAGSPERLLERLEALVDLGLDFLLLNPCYDEAEQTEAIAETLLPALRAP
jgi:alkanesulfonate monooxygenase SsuD/methylene tetrahydromethanopterin reductase-like flavin-dependent oxidoreductase (luciferase family)